MSIAHGRTHEKDLGFGVILLLRLSSLLNEGKMNKADLLQACPLVTLYCLLNNLL